jgi:hypothetical protein
MTDKTIIRRDRRSGRVTKIDRSTALEKLRGWYLDWHTVLNEATETTPASTAFADYWPEEGG